MKNQYLAFVGMLLFALCACAPVYFYAGGIEAVKRGVGAVRWCKKECYFKEKNFYLFYRALTEVLEEEGFKIVKYKKSWGHKVGFIARRESDGVEIHVRHGKEALITKRCWLEVKVKRSKEACKIPERIIKLVKKKLGE